MDNHCGPAETVVIHKCMAYITKGRRSGCKYHIPHDYYDCEYLEESKFGTLCTNGDAHEESDDRTVNSR